MAKSEAATTALFVAAVRARESKRKDHLFIDDLASTLAGPEGTAQLGSAELNPASNYHRDSFPYLEVRTRYFDDWLLGAVNGGKATQVVLLGAGMDTRAFRLDWPKGVKLWEIDTRELFAIKESRLRAARARPQCERLTVTADLGSSEWTASLRNAGLRNSDSTVWLAEGLFQYLSKETVDQILEGAASLSLSGSFFGADIISEEYIRRASNRPVMGRRAKRGVPWTFGTDNPDELFLAHGWTVDEDVTALDAAVALGRWTPRGTGAGPPGAVFISATRE